MPVFIVISLCLSYLTQTNSPLQSLLISPLITYSGLGFAIVGILGIFFNKLPESIGYDLFSSSTLLAWFASWRPDYKEDAPMFFFFPLYFALLSAITSLLLINQRQRLDRQTYRYMSAFIEKSGLEPWLLMVSVLGSLALQHHFMLFPALMTLLLIRITLSGYLQGQH